MEEPPGGRTKNGTGFLFMPQVLDRSVIAIPLLRILEEEDSALASGAESVPNLVAVIVASNLEFRGGRHKARQRLTTLVDEATSAVGRDQSVRGLLRPKRTGCAFLPGWNRTSSMSSTGWTSWKRAQPGMRFTASGPTRRQPMESA